MDIKKHTAERLAWLILKNQNGKTRASDPMGHNRIEQMTAVMDAQGVPIDTAVVLSNLETVKTIISQ